MGYKLYDPGAYPEEPLRGKITQRVTRPLAEPDDENERDAVRRMYGMIDHLKKEISRRNQNDP